MNSHWPSGKKKTNMSNNRTSNTLQMNDYYI
jgi:hypothetical protein